MGQSKRLCGNSKMFPTEAPVTMQKFRSQNNSMNVRFVSDYANQEGDFLYGFSAYYIIEGKILVANLDFQKFKQTYISI